MRPAVLKTVKKIICREVKAMKEACGSEGC